MTQLHGQTYMPILLMLPSCILLNLFPELGTAGFQETPEATKGRIAL